MNPFHKNSVLLSHQDVSSSIVHSYTLRKTTNSHLFQPVDNHERERTVPRIKINTGSSFVSETEGSMTEAPHRDRPDTARLIAHNIAIFRVAHYDSGERRLCLFFFCLLVFRFVSMLQAHQVSCFAFTPDVSHSFPENGSGVYLLLRLPVVIITSLMRVDMLGMEETLCKYRFPDCASWEKHK